MIAIGNSYCELVLDGTAPLSGRVLGEIEKLAAERTREKQIVGQAYAAWPELSARRAAGAQRSGQPVPALADACWRCAWPAPGWWRGGPALAAQPQRSRRRVVATESLDDWAQAAEDVGELRQLFRRLDARGRQGRRAHRAVLRRAQLWTGRNGKAPKTGQSVIEDLG